MRLIKSIYAFFKFMVVLTAVISIFIIYSNITTPWEGDREVSKYSVGYLSIPLGGSSEGSKILSRSYALIPLSLSTPQMLFLTKNSDSTFSADKDSFAFWLFGGFITLGWYFIIKSLVNKKSFFRPKPNKAIKQD